MTHSFIYTFIFRELHVIIEWFLLCVFFFESENIDRSEIQFVITNNKAKPIAKFSFFSFSFFYLITSHHITCRNDVNVYLFHRGSATESLFIAICANMRSTKEAEKNATRKHVKFHVSWLVFDWYFNLFIWPQLILFLTHTHTHAHPPSSN